MSSDVTALPSLPPAKAPAGVLAATGAGRRGAEPETSMPPQARPSSSDWVMSAESPGVTVTEESSVADADVSVTLLLACVAVTLPPRPAVPRAEFSSVTNSASDLVVSLVAPGKRVTLTEGPKLTDTLRLRADGPTV